VTSATGQPSLFEWAGGSAAFTRMTRLFYETYVPVEPLLAPLFANMAPDHPERVAAWLAETFGGPTTYSEQYGGYDWMVSQHAGKALTEAQRGRWVQLMCQCADEAGLPADPEFRAAFVSYLEWGSRIALENSTPGARPPRHMRMPRWTWVAGATPGSRVSALAQRSEEASVATPAPNDPLGFDTHIKPLFREQDRAAMSFAFDLWSYDDVSENADAILQQLEQGSMPCDGAWPKERVETFERWLAAGKPA
jgi:truncated hemoglobin YjbI